MWSGRFVFSVDSPLSAGSVVLIGSNIPAMVPLYITNLHGDSSASKEQNCYDLWIQLIYTSSTLSSG